MAWTLITDAISDLRTLLSDGPTDKLCYRKRVIGDVNGTNLRFKSFEFRRVTNFKTDTDLSLGIFVAGVRLDPATQITSDSPAVGEAVIVTAPTNNQRVEMSYYSQWFLDAELTVFLKNAAQWIGNGENPLTIPVGLQPAALYYAAQEAYHKLALRWAQRMAEVYKMEDAPTGENAPINPYRGLAKDAKEKSETLRKNYYARNDQAAAPLFGFALGTVQEVVPKR